MSRRRFCWRCAVTDAKALAVGLTIGPVLAWRAAGGSCKLARLYWLCWYWPGYVHPHHWSIACVHGVEPREVAQ